MGGTSPMGPTVQRAQGGPTAEAGVHELEGLAPVLRCHLYGAVRAANCRRLSQERVGGTGSARSRTERRREERLSLDKSLACAVLDDVETGARGLRPMCGACGAPTGPVARCHTPDVEDTYRATDSGFFGDLELEEVGDHTDMSMESFGGQHGPSPASDIVSAFSPDTTHSKFTASHRASAGSDCTMESDSVTDRCGAVSPSEVSAFMPTLTSGRDWMPRRSSSVV